MSVCEQFMNRQATMLFDLRETKWLFIIPVILSLLCANIDCLFIFAIVYTKYIQAYNLGLKL